MEVEVYVDINASPATIWAVITDIAGSVNHISGIKKIEVLEQPATGIVGLKWRETREMFKKEATEVMWITEAVENESYATRAQSHGAVYITRFKIIPGEEGNRLTMTFEGQAHSLMAKLMNLVFGSMMTNSTKKAMIEDLQDIKAAAENI